MDTSRYIICKGLRADVRDTVRAYMYRINEMLNQFKLTSERNDILWIVPREVLQGNERFCQYIRDSNNQWVSMVARPIAWLSI